MPQRVKRIQPIEPRSLLPLPPHELHAPLGQPSPRLGAKQRRSIVESFAATLLPLPEPGNLDDQPIWQENVASPAALGDFAADADTNLGQSVRGVDVADVETDEFAEAQAGAEGERDDDVVALVLGGGAEDQLLLVLGEGCR